MRTLIAILCLLPMLAFGQARRMMVQPIQPVVTSGDYTFVYSGTQFSTDGYLTATSLSGVSDSDKGIFSCWYKQDAATGPYGMLLSVGRMEAKFQNPENGLSAADSSGTNVLGLWGNNATTNAWHHMIISWDLGTLNSGKLYVDGVDQTYIFAFVTNSTVDLTFTDNGVAASLAAYQDMKNFYGALCEVYFTTTDSYFDLTDANNRLKFRTSGGKPENLGLNGVTPTGTQPLIYMHNSYSTFNQNLGSAVINGGSSFTITGSLSASSDSP
jgi:hypothetical protein